MGLPGWGYYRPVVANNLGNASTLTSYQAQVIITDALVTSASVSAGGTGYTLNDILTVSGGTKVQNAARLKVTGVSGGVVTSVSVYDGGDYTTAPSNPVSVTGGTGASATFNLSTETTYTNILAKCKADLSDFRFTDTDVTTLIDHWLDYHDATGKVIRVFVEVPSITGSATKTINLHYGNASASSTSNGRAVFPHFGDYTIGSSTQNYSIIATDAIHYGFSPGFPAYSSPAGSFFTSTTPHSLYDATSNKTFGVYGRYNAGSVDWYAWQYDHSSKVFTTHVIVTPAPSGADPHGNPAIAIDGSGFLHIIGCTEVVGGGAYYKSNSARDITAWTAQTWVGGTNVYEYAGLYFVGTTLYFWTRKTISSSAPTYQKSYGYFTYASGSWSAYTEVVNFTHADVGGQYNIYAHIHYDGTNHHVAWVPYQNDGATYRNVYYMKTGSGNIATWFKADGTTAVALPALATTADLALNTSTQNAWVLDLDDDGSGNPIILIDYGTTIAAPNSDSRGLITFAALTYSSGWTKTDISAKGDSLFDRGCLRRTGSTYQAVVTENGRLWWDGGDLQMYTASSYGGAWSVSNTFSVKSSPPQNSYPHFVDNANSDLEVVWGQGDGPRNGTLAGGVNICAWGSALTLPTSTQPACFSELDEGTYRSNAAVESLGSNKVTMTMTADTGDGLFVFGQTALASNTMCVRTRFKVTNTTGTPRFRPAALIYGPANNPSVKSTSGHTDNGSLMSFQNTASELLFKPDGAAGTQLILETTTTPGGTATATNLASTAPVVNHTYVAEIWQYAASTAVHAKLTDESVSNIVGNVYNDTVGKTAASRDAQTIQPMAGMYHTDANLSGMEITSFLVRQITTPEPIQTLGAEVQVTVSPCSVRPLRQSFNRSLVRR